MKKILLLTLLCLGLLLTGCSKEPEQNTDVSTLPQQEEVQDTLTATEAPTVPPCDGHVDNDANDICDLCDRSVIITVDIFSINDLHGKFLDTSTQPGVDEMTTYFENARKENVHTILLSAGDTWQGSGESNTTRGALLTQWMNQLDFAAMTLGNHEFDWGEDAIKANSEVAEFPLLAINVYNRKTNQQVDYCESSVLVECDGVQVGIIGAVGDCYSSIASDHTKEIYFQTDQHLTSLVKKESEALRQQGADFIVYVIHDGLGQSTGDTVESVKGSRIASYYDPALSDGYVDLVFEAHTHQTYLLQDEYGVYHMQHGGDNNGGISHASVQIHAIDGTCQVTEAALIGSEEYEELPDSPTITGLLDAFEEELAPVFEVLGTIDSSRPGDTLQQLVADLYFMEGLLRWGDYDIVLGGGFISIRDPGYLKRGDITYAQLQTLFPFDNELVLCSIKGRDLKERFFEAEDSRYFICCGSYGDEVRENLDPNATYYVVVDTYTSTYGPNNLTEIERYGEPVYARDLLANFIRNGGMS